MLFIIPSLILVTRFIFYPMAWSFITSFPTGTGNNMCFTGIENDTRLRRTGEQTMLPRFFGRTAFSARKVNGRAQKRPCFFGKDFTVVLFVNRIELWYH